MYFRLMKSLIVTHPQHGRLIVDREKRLAEPLGDKPVPEGSLVRTPSAGLTMVSYDLTYACPYKCVHCLSDDHRRAVDDPVAIIDEIERTGAMWLQLTGGEPLAHPRFADVYEHAWDAGLLIILLTNGFLLDRFTDLLARKPPHRISTSLYGATAGTYDAMTRKPGAFEVFLRNMRALEGQTVRVKGIVTTLNVHEAPAMRELGQELGSYFEFRNITPTVSGDAAPTMLACPEPKAPTTRWTGCGAGKTMAHVQADGSITPCRAARRWVGTWQALPSLRKEALKLPDACFSCKRPCPVCPPVYRSMNHAHLNPCKECSDDPAR